MRNREFLEPSLVIMMNDSFGKWIREAMPKPNEDRVRSEVQLAVLKERIRQGNALRKKRRTRIGLFATPVLLAMVISLNVVDLGGDGFELVQVDEAKTPGIVVKNEFRGGGFNVLSNQSEEEIEEFNQQLAAGQGVVIEIEGWEIKGKEEWTIIRENNVRGNIFKSGAALNSPPTDSPPELAQFLIKHWDKYEREIGTGSLPVSGQMTKNLDGFKFILNYWLIETEEFGEVTYYSGVPTH